MNAAGVRTFGFIEATVEEIAVLRKQPGLPGGLTLPRNFLHHSEDQTVAATAAVLRAIHSAGMSLESFADWAVLGAPRFPGRMALASSFDKFRTLGTLSVSPLVIPNASLHSISSTLSLALHSHGPSFGVGGTADGFVQALLAVLTFRAEDTPGVWVVMAGWDPEIVPCAKPETKPVCRAAALALIPGAAGVAGSGLRLVPRVGRAIPAKANLVELVRFLAEATRTGAAGCWSCPIDGGLDLELSLAPAVSSLARSA